MRRYVDWLIDHGVHGLYPNGSTGEFTRFTAEERRRIIEIIADQTRGRVPILAGAAEANVRETITACEYYHALGCRAVAIVSPFYYKLSPAGVYAYFKEIADNTPIDVTLYNIPMFASPIDVPTVQRLAEECPRVVGDQGFSSGDLPHMMRMIAAVRPMRPDFSFLTGWDAALMPMLLDRLRRRHQRHQRRRARNHAQAVRPDDRRPNRRSPRPAIPPADAVRRDALLGRIPRRLPRRASTSAASTPATAASRNRPCSSSSSCKLQRPAPMPARRRRLHATNRVGGCRAGDSLDPEHIARIVQGVVGELKKRGIA